METRGRSIARLLGGLVLALTIITGLAAAAMAAATAGLLLSPSMREAFTAQAAAVGGASATIARAPGLLLVVVLILVLACLLLLRLRAVLRTVEGGEPFHPSNPGNLRQIALLLASIEIVRVGTQLFLLDLSVSVAADVDGWVVSAMSVLIVFVLAEVFREGARLRAEAELTV